MDDDASDMPQGSHYQETGIQDRAGPLHTEGELRAAKEYAEMIVDSVRESLLILDLNLRVKAANQSFFDKFQLEPEEAVGELIYELGGGQWDVLELRKLLEDVLPEDKVMNDFEMEPDFEGLGRRIMLLNARRADDHELILLAIEDVTERRKTRRQLKELNEELEERAQERTRRARKLASALSEAEKKERERISYLLHEDLQQLLFGAELSMRQVKRLTARHSDPDAKKKQEHHLQQLEKILEEATRETKTLSVELNPPVATGEDLPATLEWLGEHMEKRHGLAVEVDVEEGFQAPSEELRTFLFQLTRELLFNVVKHAEVGQADVHGEMEAGQLVLQVQDEGKGFDKHAAQEQPTSKGLRDLRRRLEALGGEMNIDTAPGEGTCVTIQVALR